MGLRLNVLAKDGWILERLARETVAGIEGAAYNATGYPPNGDGGALATYFMPMMDARMLPTLSGLRLGLFTHGEERCVEALAAFRWDACVVMNERIRSVMIDAGAPIVLLARPGVEPPKRRPRFGVCGHFHNRRRKGVGFIANAVKAGFDFVACGNPKEGDFLRCPIAYTTRQRDEFYDAIDYLVVTSRDEGGPMTVPEAIAHGVPVIAPDVGWSWEFPVIRYERGSWPSLRAVLQALSEPPTWDAWREAHRALFEDLLARDGSAPVQQAEGAA